MKIHILGKDISILENHMIEFYGKPAVINAGSTSSYLVEYPLLPSLQFNESYVGVELPSIEIIKK